MRKSLFPVQFRVGFRVPVQLHQDVKYPGDKFQVRLYGPCGHTATTGDASVTTSMSHQMDKTETWVTSTDVCDQFDL